MRFEIDNITYEVPAPALISIYSRYNTPHLSYCRLRVMVSPLAKYWILGLNFLHGYYSVFDAHKKRVGFAKSNK